MLAILFWIAFGVLVGWVAAILQDEQHPQRIGVYLLAGMLGGLVGGYGGGLLTPGLYDFHTGSTNITFAVFGATAFVMLARLAADRLPRP